tara:strand:+ start:1203 stop:1511 length:309 start_codon:yes stop_codon:yes gene_type:complete
MYELSKKFIICIKNILHIIVIMKYIFDNTADCENYFSFDFDYFDDILYDENRSVFQEPKKRNYYKMYYLSHNTYTFLSLNREPIVTMLKKNKHILSYVFEGR